MPNFSKKNYKLFLWIPDIREIYVKLFTNIIKSFTNFRKNYKFHGLQLREGAAPALAPRTAAPKGGGRASSGWCRGCGRTVGGRCRAVTVPGMWVDDGRSMSGGGVRVGCGQMAALGCSTSGRPMQGSSGGVGNAGG
jgi:hypothetical protein